MRQRLACAQIVEENPSAALIARRQACRILRDMSRWIVLLMALFALLLAQVALAGTPMMDSAMGEPVGTAAPCHPLSPDAPSSDDVPEPCEALCEAACATPSLGLSVLTLSIDAPSASSLPLQDARGHGRRTGVEPRPPNT